jgi:RND family efflux transporter MFP subunit
MKNITQFFKRHAYIYSGILIVIIIIAVTAIYKSKAVSTNDTLTVHAQNFAENLSVTGTVTAVQNVDLDFAQGGRITAVNTIVGDQVTAGTVLAEVENGDLEATLEQKQAALQTAKDNLQTTEQGTRPEQLAIDQSQVTSDQTAITQAEQSSATALTNAYATVDSTFSSDIDQLYTSPRTNPSFGVIINGSNNTTYNIQGGSLEYTVNNERTEISDLMNTWNSLNQTLAAAPTEQNISSSNTSALQTLQSMQTLISNLSSILTGYSSQDTTAQSIYNGFKSALSTAETTVNSTISSINAATTADTADQSALAKDQKTLELAQAGSTSEDINSSEANVTAAEADVANAEAQVAKTIITAPFDGTVTAVNAKVGETADTNSTEISMDSNGVFQIDSYVPEVYISNLAVGDTASTTLDAYGANTYFPIKVVAIDPAETVVNGVSNYKTTLQFLNADPRIKSGMTANISITTANVPNAFVMPQGAVFTKNGQQYVELLQGKKTVDVAVVTGGSSSIGEVQITSGLRDGDVVLLDPKTS